MTVIVVGRELLVTALRSFLEAEGADFSASWAGKWKMAFQCAAVVASLLALREHVAESRTLWYGSATLLPAWLYWGLFVTAWLSVVSTVQSGVDYIFKAAQLMSRAR